jgi:hypothetical protein
VPDLTPIAFPLEGTWLGLNPPGHPRHACDISGIGPDRHLFKVPWWKVALAQAHAEDLYGWGRPISSPVAGEVVTAIDEVDDRDRLNPIVDVPASMRDQPLPARKGRIRVGASAEAPAF